MTRMRHLLAVGSACAITSLGLVACGGDKKKATSTTAAPESTLAPDAAVTAGLHALAKVATSVAKFSDPTVAKAAAMPLETIWSKIEGTVKKNEPDIYATIEEDLTLLNSGEPRKTAQGSAELGDQVKSYLAKHP